MISFTDVTITYPLGNIALHNINFSVQEGSFTYLVGPSGAGKTTILRLVLAELLPTSGSISVDSFQITNKKFKDIAKLRQSIGVVFQDFKILSEKNVFENIAISMSVKGIAKGKIQQEVVQALELVRLPDKAHLFPAQLSAGELQRVAIARAIVGDRKIILADEPTGNLDPKTTWEIMKIFKKLESEKTILFATHNTDIVNSLKRRVVVLEDGSIKKDIQKGGYEL